MNWLLITLIAYLLNAIAIVIDKTLLKKEIKNPFAYAFYIGTLGMIVAFLLIILFGVDWPGLSQFGIALLTGATFAVGLFLMFFGLKKEDTSRLTPMIGGLVPIFVFGLAYYFLKEQLSGGEVFAFIVIIIGTFFISLDFGRNRKIRKALLLAIPAALFFAASAVLTKDVYNHQSFFSGLFWISLGTFLLVLIPIFWPKNRRDIIHGDEDSQKGKIKFRFLFGQTCGGLSNLLVKYAISLTSVTLVQALQGVQYVFIFIMVLVLAKYFPKILKEEMKGFVLVQKIVSILFIGAGIYLLAI